MRKQILRIKSLVAHPLFSGSAIMIIGSNLANFFAYLFHLVVGRMLGPSGYGDLASILSLIGLFSITFGFLGLVIVKFVSGMRDEEIPSFYSWVTKKSLIAAVAMAAFILVASTFLSGFLNVSRISIILAAPLLFVLFLGSIYSSFLQGTLRFGRMVVSSNVGLLGRLIFGALFVYFGLYVFGALLGVFVSALIGLLVAIYFLRDFWKVRSKHFVFKQSSEVFAYAVPIFIMSLATNSLYMTDVILVKHFFSSHMAGIYASLSTMGKIIFYGTTPIAAVMFPLVSKTHARGGNYKKVFFLSVLLTSALVIFLIVLYWLFPNLVLQILYGNKFLEGAPYLVWFGVFIGLFTLSSLFLNYFLSKGTTKVVYLGLLAAITQVVGIYFFHKDIVQVISVSITVSLILLILLLIYFWYEARFGHNPGLQGGKVHRKNSRGG